MKQKYSIYRYYMNRLRRKINDGLTLEQAQEHCTNPETSSQTCRLAKNKQRTKKLGPWFDGYTAE